MTRTHDSAAVTAASVVAATLVAQQVAGKAARDALFLAAFHVSSLPAMMIVSAALSALSAILFARAMRRSSPAQSLTLGLVVFALLSLVCGFLSETWPQLVAAAFYLQVTLFGAVLLSAFWSVVNERFDPYSAKQAISKIAGGATLGGVVGGLFAWLAARYVSVSGLLYAMALASALCIAGLRWLHGAAGAKSRPAGDLDEIATGLGVFKRTPYLKDLALLVGLGSLVDALLDYALKSEAAARYSGGDALFGFFSSYAAIVGLVTFLAQSLVSRPALARLGLGGTVALQPGGVFLLTLLGALDPGLLTATLARGGAAALRDSVFRSGYELLYTPLPPTLKRASKAVVDVAVDRLGTVLGSAITLVVAALLPRPTGALLALAAGLALVATTVCRRLHRGYVLALETNLRIGAVQVPLEEVVDGTTLAVTRSALGLDRHALLAEIRALRGDITAGAASAESTPPGDDHLLRDVADLRSGSKDRIRAVLDRPEGFDLVLVGHVIPLLVRRDLAPDALRALRPLASKITGQLVDALQDAASEPALRRRVARILKSSPTPRSVEGLLLGLADPDASVRVECGKVLGAVKAAQPSLVVRKDAVFEAVQRELASPNAASGTVALDHVFALLSLVLETEPVLISLQALRGGNKELRGTALEYLDNVLPRAVRDALWPALGVPVHGAPSSRASLEVERELIRSMSGMSAVSLRRALLRPAGRPLPEDRSLAPGQPRGGRGIEQEVGLPRAPSQVRDGQRRTRVFERRLERLRLALPERGHAHDPGRRERGQGQRDASRRRLRRVGDGEHPSRPLAKRLVTGEQRAHVAVRAHAHERYVEGGRVAQDRHHLGLVVQGRGLEVGCVGLHAVDLRHLGADGPQEEPFAEPVVRVGMVGRHRPLVAPEEAPTAPVEARRGERGKKGLGRGAAGQRDREPLRRPAHRRAHEVDEAPRQHVHLTHEDFGAHPVPPGAPPPGTRSLRRPQGWRSITGSSRRDHEPRRRLRSPCDQHHPHPGDGRGPAGQLRATPAPRWPWRPWSTTSGSDISASTPTIPSGPTATASSCPRATRRCCSIRCCISPG